MTTYGNDVTTGRIMCTPGAAGKFLAGRRRNFALPPLLACITSGHPQYVGGNGARQAEFSPADPSDVVRMLAWDSKRGRARSGGGGGYAPLPLPVRAYRRTDREALLRFRRRAWPGCDLATEPYFRWQYEEGPLGPPEQRIWVGLEGGEVIAHQGALPARLRVGARRLRAGWAMEIFVDPHTRGAGLGTALNDAHRQAFDLALSMEISFAAQRTFLRAGWTDLGTMPVWWRPLDPARVLAGHFGDAARLPARAAGRLLRGADRLVELATAIAGPRERRVARFGPEADDLFERTIAGVPVACERDHHWMNWRFAEGPQRRRYRLYELRTHAGRLVGAVVLRHDQRFGLPVGWIVDHLVDPEWLLPVFARVLSLLRRQGAAAAYTLWLSRRAPALRRLGFLRRDSGWQLMFRADGQGRGITDLLSRPDHWHLTGGDSNVDRPRPARRAP